MQNYKFNIYFMENLKRTILAGDFNLNLIKRAQKTGVNQFLQIVLSNNFHDSNNPPYKSGSKISNTYR